MLVTVFRINEGTFKSYTGNIHLLDVPMFSIFLSKKILKSEFYTSGNPLIKNILEPDGIQNYLNTYEDGLKRLCAETKSYLGKIGFSSMHANLVINDLRGKWEKSKNVPASLKNVSDGPNGMAHGTKYISLDASVFHRFNKNLDGNHAVEVLSHEWAHLWMHRHSKQFNETIQELYSKLVTPHLDKQGLPTPTLDGGNMKVLQNFSTYVKIIVYLKEQIKWVNAYGMTNSKEFWATAIELFFKLPNEHKKLIVKLISQKH